MSINRIVGEVQFDLLYGIVTAGQTLAGNATHSGTLSGQLATAATTHAPPYDGNYVVTPMVDEQKLPTANSYLLEDVTIKAIPVYNVSNPSGGSTFYIATMDEDPNDGKAVLGKTKLGFMIL